MGRPTRHFDPTRVYRVTNCTLPDRSLAPGGVGPRNRMGIWLSRALQSFPVDLYGVMTLPDRYVWLLRGEGEVVSDFVGYVQGNVARALNRLQGLHQRLWSRQRFTALAVEGGVPAWTALADLLALPTRLGYVGHPRDWPLLSSYPELVAGRERAFAWLDRTGWHRAGRPDDDTRWWHAATLEHTPLPGLDRHRLRDMLEARVAKPHPAVVLPYQTARTER